MSSQQTPYHHTYTIPPNTIPPHLYGLFGERSMTYRTHYTINGTEVSNAKRSINNGSAQEPHLLLTTIKLEKDDKITIRVGGYMWKLNDPKTTYFEGRLVTVINE